MSPLNLSRRTTLALSLALVLLLTTALVASANVTLNKLSTDPYTNSTSQHQTEVEPDSYSFGSTIVSTVQVGRFTDGGSSNIGWATSTNSGASWTNGFLPGLTVFSTPAGPYARASDPSVTFDAAHNVWLINSLGLSANVAGAADVVNRSTDGGLTWGNAVVIASATGAQNFDKNWIVCDNSSASSFFGHCYAEFDDAGGGNQLKMYFSTDGGLTWTQSTTPASGVIGGQPLVQRNGRVVMPIANAFETSLLAFVSTNGGTSFIGPRTISNITSHGDAGGIRSGPLPSAEVDRQGKVFVVWADCRFRTGCSANDIVMSTSTTGSTWTAPVRIPIDDTTSGIDHFIPGIAVDKTTAGTTARLAITYYYYPVSNCTSTTCSLNVGMVTSADGGTTWSAPTQLAGPMTLSWLPNTTQGRMVGDYISSSFAGGKAFGFFAVANPPTAGGTNCATATPNCDQGLYTNAVGLSVPAGLTGLRPVADDPILSTSSDHPALTTPARSR